MIYIFVKAMELYTETVAIIQDQDIIKEMRDNVKEMSQEQCSTSTEYEPIIWKGLKMKINGDGSLESIIDGNLQINNSKWRCWIWFEQKSIQIQRRQLEYSQNSFNGLYKDTELNLKNILEIALDLKKEREANIGPNTKWKPININMLNAIKQIHTIVRRYQKEHEGNWLPFKGLYFFSQENFLTIYNFKFRNKIDVPKYKYSVCLGRNYSEVFPKNEKYEDKDFNQIDWNTVLADLKKKYPIEHNKALIVVACVFLCLFIYLLDTWFRKQYNKSKLQ